MEETGKQQRERMLLQAAFDGNLRLFRKMARGLDTGQGEAAVVAAVADSGSGNRALHLAATEGRMDVCRYLVEDLRLDVNQPNDRGSPLHGAAGKGHCAIVELLLSRGIDVDLDSVHGTLLHVAATRGQYGTMKILLEHHADPNKVFNLDDTPLNMAMCTESLKCVKLLIKAGADVNFIDSNGDTYVMVAANNGLPGILKCLLDAGANPNIPDGFGTTPIEVAALLGRREIVEMLFPITSPISTLPDWSIDGIISHMKSCGSKPMDKHLCEKKRAELKLQGREAFKREKYMMAGQLYTNAMRLCPSDNDRATLLANRSLCWLRLENGKRALCDATMCRMLQPHWPKAHYRLGAAFMFLKHYKKACEAFADGLRLDPTNVDIENALREALEAMKNTHCAEKKRSNPYMQSSHARRS